MRSTARCSWHGKPTKPDYVPRGSGRPSPTTHPRWPRSSAARYPDCTSGRPRSPSSADIGYVTPHDTDQARAIVAEIRAAQAEAGRAEEPLHIFGDLVVFLDDEPTAAADRKARLDGLAGYPYTSDAEVFTGAVST
jgi:hypothetical protein